MKNHIITIIIFCCALLQACKNDAYNPDKYFSKEQQSSIISQTVRYSAKLAPYATQSTKFSSEFDEYYGKAAAQYDLRKCVPDANEKGEYYFLMTRQARSIWPAREAIGGKFKVDNKNELVDYEEIFRTWKMTEDSLNTRAFELFDHMVKGDDLTPYRSKYKADRYIEFPDDRFTFNKKDKQWQDSAFDSLKLNQ
jgi:hypothetical protein